MVDWRGESAAYTPRGDVCWSSESKSCISNLSAFCFRSYNSAQRRTPVDLSLLSPCLLGVFAAVRGSQLALCKGNLHLAALTGLQVDFVKLVFCKASLGHVVIGS